MGLPDGPGLGQKGRQDLRPGGDEALLAPGGVGRARGGQDLRGKAALRLQPAVVQRPAVPPLHSTARTGETDVILATSTGTTFLMLASDEPRTSQLWTTSQRATQWARRRRLFAGMSSSAGTSSPRTRAMTRQKRLRGLP